MNYIKIERDNLVNGPGIRTVLWVSGCNRHCAGCHNPETWDFHIGQLFTETTMNELIGAMSPDHITGLTITGGDPMLPGNIEVVFYICQTIKKHFPDKSIWIYTGGLYEEYINSTNVAERDIFKYVDVLVDGRFDISLKNNPRVKWRGSSNQRLIDVKASLERNETVLYKE